MKPDYRLHVDGMRAIAILLVVAYHVSPSSGVQSGYLGVDLFFVISGFVISRKLWGEASRHGRISWSRFLRGRLHRLFPAYAAMVLVVLVLGTALLAPLGDAQGLAKSSLASTAFIGNVYYWHLEPTDYFQPPARGPAIMLHTWSLGVEEQFYLGIAIVACLAGLTRLRAVRAPSVTTLVMVVAAASLGSFAAAVWLAPAHAGAAFYSPVLRLWEFGVGALALLCSRSAQRHGHRVLALAAVGLLASLAATSALDASHAPLIAACPVVAMALMLWGAEGRESPVRAVLTAPPLVGLGRLSYSWYLWHWPVLGLAEAYYLGDVGVPWRLASVLLALGVAACSYRFVELRYWTPVHARGTSRARTPVRRTRHVAIMLVVALLAGGSTGWVARQRADSPAWALASAQQLDQPYLPSECSALDADGVAEVYSVGCAVYDASVDDRLVVLWGDSHAWQYVPGLERAARDAGVSLIAWVGAGCPPTLALPSSTGLASDQVSRYHYCDLRNRRAFDFIQGEIESGRDVTVVYASRWPMYFGGQPLSLADRAAFDADRNLIDRIGGAMRNDLPHILDEVGAAGARQVVVAPIPELRREAPLCLALSRPYRCDVDVATETLYLAEARGFVDSLTAREPGISVVDPSEVMCDARSCRNLDGSQAMYFDDDHLSATYAAALAPLFRDAVSEPAGPNGPTARFRPRP